jgi:hypothetical protein
MYGKIGGLVCLWNFACVCMVISFYCFFLFLEIFVYLLFGTLFGSLLLQNFFCLRIHVSFIIFWGTNCSSRRSSSQDFPGA